jgi:hypothetical protein
VSKDSSSLPTGRTTVQYRYRYIPARIDSLLTVFKVASLARLGIPLSENSSRDEWFSIIHNDSNTDMVALEKKSQVLLARVVGLLYIIYIVIVDRSTRMEYCETFVLVPVDRRVKRKVSAHQKMVHKRE